MLKNRIKELRRGVPASSLRPHPSNWRVHPEAQRAAFRSLLDEVGLANAVLAREQRGGTLQLIDGHLRVEELGDQPVDVLVLDVSEQEAKKLLLALDPLGAMAEADGEQLAALLAEVAAESEGLQELFDVLEGQAQAARSATAIGEVAEDPIPDPPKKPVSRPGDLWLLGNQRLLCGDSTNEAHVKRLMKGEQAILFATDPPYLVQYTGTNHLENSKDWSDKYVEQGTQSEAEGETFYREFVRLALPHLLPNAAWYCWHASRRQAMLEKAWVDHGAFVHQQLIWFKSRKVLTRSTYLWNHEPCFFGWKQGHRPPNYHAAAKEFNCTVWQIPNSESETADHPTCKPNRIFAIPMVRHTKPGELCYEPFSGSGSQLVTAEQLGRRCFALELSPAFCDVAVERWQELAGRKARRATGKGVAAPQAWKTDSQERRQAARPAATRAKPAARARG